VKALAALAATGCLACGDAGNAPPLPPDTLPPDTLPPDTAIVVGGMPITSTEVDALLPFYLLWRPELGPDSARAVALEFALIPRALARRDFAEGVVKAREKIRHAQEMLAAGKTFEEVRALLSEAPIPPVPLPQARNEVDPLLGAEVFGRASGYFTPQPVETTYACVLARVDLPLPSADPRQQAVVLSTIEALYDASLANRAYREARSRDATERARYEVRLPEAYGWLPSRIAVRLK
jgi:hypothetical protein